MFVKIKIPKSTETKNQSDCLVPNKKTPRKKWRGPLAGFYPIKYSICTDFVSDGERLVIKDEFEDKVLLIISAIFLIIASILFWWVSLSDYSIGDGGINLFFAKLFSSAAGIILFITYLFDGVDYYVFDRITGLVRFPKQLFSPAFTIPFSDCELYEHYKIYPTQHGGFRRKTTSILYPRIRPNPQFFYRGYRIPIVAYRYGFSKEEHTDWAFLKHFMDQSKVLPAAEVFSRRVEIFKTQNKKIDDLPFPAYSEEEIEEFYWECVSKNFDDL